MASAYEDALEVIRLRELTGIWSVRELKLAKEVIRLTKLAESNSCEGGWTKWRGGFDG